MYSFTIQRNPYKIPSLASELTLKQFIDIGNAKDEREFLTALIGKFPVVNIKNDKDVLSIEQELSGVYRLIDLLREDLERTVKSGILLVQPKSVEILGLTIEIKHNFVKSLPWFGYIHTKHAIEQRVQQGNNESFNATDLIPDILAHNLYALVNKTTYNEAKADEFQDVIKEMNFIQAMQLGNFFLIQQKKLWTSRRKRLVMSLTVWRLTLVSRILTSLGQRTHLKPLPVETYLNGNL